MSVDQGGATANPEEVGRSLEAGPARRVGPPDAQAPRQLVLPSGRSVRVRPASTLKRGVLDVPDDVGEAGWWRGSARLGDAFGSTLVAGHVDGIDVGLGAFAELLEVRPGQRVRLRSRTLEQPFLIRSRRLLPREATSGATYLYSVRGPRRLTLVTCAPPYLPDRGGYQRLAVVTAVPDGPPDTEGRS
ncbi:class F sortase [Nocardioides sp. YIM 152315]|uniref:class F sortase n=1 Tax=Nocardioides sp. YIM 152315 TaxID=3031760 RepID=UPI0023DAFFC3|nr:class F sortase [Nocardioides sp. YIM 152315]MDF1606005.1 class F sortase [Nocardioides sp. YIM 152315]